MLAPNSRLTVGAGVHLRFLSKGGLPGPGAMPEPLFNHVYKACAWHALTIAGGVQGVAGVPRGAIPGTRIPR